MDFEDFDWDERLETLTDWCREVAKLRAEGLTTGQIAKELRLPVKEVKESGDGGGIFNGIGNYTPTLTMSRYAEVNWNRAGNDGGGIFNEGTLSGIVAGVNVEFNTPNDVAP